MNVESGRNRGAGSRRRAAAPGLSDPAFELEEALQDPGGISGLPPSLRADIGHALNAIARGAGASAGGVLRTDDEQRLYYYGDLPKGFGMDSEFIEMLGREESRRGFLLKGTGGRDLPCVAVAMPGLNADLRFVFFGLQTVPDPEALEGALASSRAIVRLARGTRDFLIEREMHSTTSRLLSVVLAPMPIATILAKLAQLIAEATASAAVALDSYSPDINLIARNLHIDPARPDAAGLLSRWQAISALRMGPPKDPTIDRERLRAWRQARVFDDIQARPAQAFGRALEDEIEFYQDAGLRTVLLQPLWVGKELVGTLSLADGKVRSYSSGELNAVARIGDVAAVAIRGSQLSREVDESHARERDAYVGTIARLAAAAEARDPFTGAHLEHLQHYARAIATAMGKPADFVQAVVLASQMHDIGKISLPDSILLKPGPLTFDEREIMKKHTVDGEMLLDGRHLEVARRVARWHHERWDGYGYPDGLSKAEIPVCARIVSVADVYHALTSERPYKRAWDPENAYSEILRNAGTQFDPEIVEVFGELWRQGALAGEPRLVA